MASVCGGGGTYWASRRSRSSGYTSDLSITETHANESTATNETAMEKNQTNKMWPEVDRAAAAVAAIFARSNPFRSLATGVDQLAQKGSGEEAPVPKADNGHLEVTRDPNPRHWNYVPSLTLTGNYPRPSWLTSYLSVDEAIRNFAQVKEETRQITINSSRLGYDKLTIDLLRAVWVYHYDYFCDRKIEASPVCKIWSKRLRPEMVSSAVETAMSNVKWSAAIYNSIGRYIESLNQLYRRIHADYCLPGFDCDYDFWLGLRVSQFCRSNSNNQNYRKFCKARSYRLGRGVGLHLARPFFKSLA